jgi:hypothetical protein
VVTEGVGVFWNGVNDDLSSERVFVCGGDDPSGIDAWPSASSVCVGVSHDPAALAAHSIVTWWKHDGSRFHCTATELLILADGRQQQLPLLGLENRTQEPIVQPAGITITVAHYPTGASKSNPIERRLYPRYPTGLQPDRQLITSLALKPEEIPPQWNQRAQSVK